MTAAEVPGDRSESRDSTLFEFIDPVVDFTPRPPRDQTLRRAPEWLRERRPDANRVRNDSLALAESLLAQARLLRAQGRFAEAVAVSDEAVGIHERLSERAPTPTVLACLADSCHLAAELREALGRSDEALALFRREADLRRRLSA